MARRFSRRTAVLCAVIGSSPLIVRAATDTWTGASGNWSAGPWSLSHAPGTNDLAILSNAGGASVVVNLDANVSVNQFEIDSLASGLASFQQSGNAFTTGAEYLGSARAGVSTLNGGTHTINGDLFLGYGVNASGTLSLGGGMILLPTGSIHVGYSGLASVSMTGGFLSASNGSTFIGDQFTGNGSFNQSGGTHSTGSLYVGSNGQGNYALSNGATLSSIGLISIGDNSTGSFTQTGGSVAAGGFFIVGRYAVGTYAFSGGLLTATNLTSYIGVSASGAFSQTGGSFNAGNLEVGYLYGANGQYTLNGGTVSVGGNLIIADGGAGSFNQSSGAVNATSLMTIGNTANGSFLQSGGVSSFGSMTLGASTGGLGFATVSTSAVLTTTGTLTVGGSGAGSLVQTGGTANAGALILANSLGSSGAFTLSGGVFKSSGLSYIGYQGTANLTISAGGATFSTLNLAGRTGSTSSATISGGILSASTVYLGGDSNTVGGAATFTSSTGGSVVINGSLNLYTNNANTAINLTGGSISVGSLNLGGSLARLHWSAGSLNITGTNGLLIDAASTTGSTWSLNNGQSLFVGGATETIANGSFTQSGGTHTANVSITPAGTYTLNGGVFNGSISVAGSFNASGGSFNSSLAVQSTGTATLSGAFSATLGSTIYGNAVVTSAGAFAGPVDIEGGLVMLNGGTLGGSDPITNYGTISGYGTLSGSFTNSAILTQVGGNLTLQGSAPAVNAGTLNLASGRQLSLNSALSNSGSLSLDGAIIGGTSTLVNLAAGTLNGPGLIRVPFTNAGNLLVPAGALTFSQLFTNTGVIQLTSTGSSLSAPGIVNSATLQGFGSVASPLTNTGTVEAIGGTLVFTSPLNNTGIARVSTGNKILLQGGLTTNTGTISLTGGTFDASDATLTNNGQITGYGTLATAGLMNNSSLTLAGGTSTLNGPLTNSLGGTVRVNSIPAVFTGPVTNNGTFLVTSATVTFANGFVNNGIYSSDPSTMTAPDLNIGSAGVLTATAGDRFITSGDFSSTSTQRANWDTTQAALIFTAGGTHMMTIASADLGPTLSGFDHNFAWGTLELSPGQSLSLQPQNDGDALYLHTLLLDGEAGDLYSYLSTHLLTSSDIHIYYDPTDNADLRDAIYPLANGAELLPAPEPTALPLAALTFIAARRRRRGVPRKTESRNL